MPVPDRDPAIAAAAPAGDDRALLFAAVREAGDLARTLHAGTQSVRRKPDNSPVSDADIAVDALLKDRLTTPRPGYGWLSEETEDDLTRRARRRLWLVDPIDGTRSFIAGGDQWCISAALAVDGRPVLAAVYNPLRDAFYSAERGGGAALNDAPIRASARAALAGARVIAQADLIRSSRWAEPWPTLDVSMSKSIALRLCLVASGAVDATFALNGKSDWDLAAGQLIVEEAGGLVSGLDGGAIEYNRASTRHPGVIAAGAPLHPELVRRIRGFRRKGRGAPDTPKA